MKWKLTMTRTCICVGSFGLANSQHKTPEKYEIESNRMSSSSEEENRVSLSLRKSSRITCDCFEISLRAQKFGAEWPRACRPKPVVILISRLTLFSILMYSHRRSRRHILLNTERKTEKTQKRKYTNTHYRPTSVCVEDKL